MSQKVFLSGSITIKRLNDAMRERIAKIVAQSLPIVIGDAGGADKAMQQFLAELRYPHVEVFCVGGACRNNVGDWRVHHVTASDALKGRELFMQKDKAMAAEADYGLVLWDGKSPGSISNVFELAEAGKAVVVYFAPEKRFHTVKRASDIRELLHHCAPSDYASLSRKIPVERRLDRIAPAAQGSLGF